MGSKTATGTVSAQAAAGETVTVTITKPDGTKVTQTATTSATGGFTLTYTDNPGNYSSVFHIDADAGYVAADSSAIPFTIPLGARTITATWA